MKMKYKSKFLASVAVSIAWIIFQLYIAIVSPLHPMLQSPVHLLFALLIVFINNPADKSGERPWMKLIDIPIFIGITYLFYYFVSQTSRLQGRVPYISPIEGIDMIAMVVMMVILFEAVRRVLGLTLTCFIGVFVLYAWFGKYAPALFKFRGTNLKQFTELMIMGPDGILGTPLYTSASYLFYFIMFGVLFSACGGGQLLIDIGMKFSDKSSSGPAKAAVISSGLMGMVSGSAVANVSTTGVMTIPMMKKVGYEPEQAGAIEAIASTGGQIMPPIMGVGAFIMAEMLGVPYSRVAFGALIPAIAYYLSVLLLVHFIAKKKHLNADSDAVKFDSVRILPRLYLLIPAFVLVYYMVSGASLMKAGLMGIYSVLIINVISRFILGGQNYVPLKELGQSIIQGIKQASEIAIPTAACGIIIGIVIQSGLATKVSSIIARVGGGNIILALGITTLGCMLLGMALPTVAAYLVSNVLFVPILIRLGIPALPANMFVFYFGIMAQITPPVCLASFTAAGIAGADSWKTGWTGFRFSLVAFLIPFIFVFNPGILLIGTPLEIVVSSVILFFGTYLFAGAMAGYLFIPLEKYERAILFVAAITLIVPELITDVVGSCLGIIMIGYLLMKRNKKSVKLGESAE
ncbi:TRAP transporter permease [Alkaliphilus crotonatoxidans]